MVVNLPANAGDAGDAGDTGLIPGSGISPGKGNGNPLEYSCLENPTDRGARQATVHGVAKSQTQLSELAHVHFPPQANNHLNSLPPFSLEKEVSFS